MDKVYVVYTNSDCTEGRGYDIPIAVCKIRATAVMVAKGQYVQGMDGPIAEIEVVEVNGKKYLPLSVVPIHQPTKDQEKAQVIYDKQQAAMARLLAAGATKEDITDLLNGKT